MLLGAILCRGPRMVTSILRVMGLAEEKRFEKYHRVLNRGRWNSINAAKILLGLLLKLLPITWPILMPIDETIERRKGKNIAAKGCYRDACRSSDKEVVKCFGLKWICLTILIPLPWSSRYWALPFLTVLAPSRKYNESRGRRHKTSIDWTITLLRLTTRWVKRPWIMLGDGGFACVRLGWACIKQRVTLISRLRLDACLYEFPSQLSDRKRGRKALKGKRASSLKQRAEKKLPWQKIKVVWYGGKTKEIEIVSGINLWYTPGEKPLPIKWVMVRYDDNIEVFYSTNLKTAPEKIIEWYVLRWNIEVTFEEMRAHMGFETQRQWSHRAIARCTPILMGLFSLVCLMAQSMKKRGDVPIASTAWYNKENEATYSDTLAFVRRAIWARKYFNDSTNADDFAKIQQNEWNAVLDLLCAAA